MSSPDQESPRTLTSIGRAVVAAAAIVLAGGGIMTAAVKFGKTAGEAPVQRPVPDVQTVTAAIEDVKLVLESQGLVQAVTETRAAAEVPGRIVKVFPGWDAGGRFTAGEELLRIDDADYRAALASAEAAAAEALLQVRLEEERGAQAGRDWDKLGGGSKPSSDLVTRVPQLGAAKARSAAAAAAVEKARRDLERTILRAPYDGCIRATLTDIGSYAAPAAPLAEFYATGSWQVSLPLSLEDFALLDPAPAVPVTLTAAGIPPVTATLRRSGGEIDRASRTIQVTAEIKPGPEQPLPPLMIPGLFVKARLPGVTLKSVVKLPRVCLLPDSRMAVVTAAGRLSFRSVTVARSTRDEVLLSAGIQAGDRVLATPLAVATEGMEVKPMAPPEPSAATTPAGKNL